MIQSKMIEKEEDLVCSLNHKLPIYMVICEKNLDKNKRLLCNECMNNLENNINVMSFKKVTQLILEIQKKKLESVEQVVMMNINQIYEIQKILNKLKQYIIQQLNQIISNTEEWIKSLQQIGQQNVYYSFFEELDNLINEFKITEFDKKLLVAQINIMNDSQNQKIIKKLNEFKLFELSKNCEELLSNLLSINQQTDLIKQIDFNQEKQQINNLMFTEFALEFKLLDDINQQMDFGYSLVFNKTGSIMISNDKSIIKVWNFTQGILQLSNEFKVHKDFVQCLVYSKKMDCFISGSLDKSIICWKQINQNEWKWSQPYQKHINWVQCLILNKQEDQIISGAYDKSIKIWNVDFIKNELTYLYSLDNSHAVYSLSFNKSETMFASCSKYHYLIWQKGVEDKWELKCKQQITEGFQICFLNDQQFIWITKDKNIDQILIFELQDGVFKQNQNKTIQLNKNELCEDDRRNFPIIYNKDKNILLVRHKHHIYIISKVNEENFKIIGSLNCEIDLIYGTMTDNAQYLVFWDRKQKRYASYELLFK